MYAGPVGFPLKSNPEQLEESEAASARARLRVLQLKQYEMVLAFEPGMIFKRHFDDLLEAAALDKDFVGRKDSTAPLDSGLFMIRPMHTNLVNLDDTAKTQSFDLENGWIGHGPIAHWSRSRKTDWSFPGSSTDRGLLYYYFFCHPNYTSQPNRVKLHEQNMWSDRATRREPAAIGSKSDYGSDAE